MAVKVVRFNSGKYGIQIWNKGKRKRKVIGTKAAAEKARKLAEVNLAKIDLGIQTDRNNTVSKYVAKYLDLIQASKAPSTFTRYRGLCRTIQKEIGTMHIGAVTRGDIRDMLLRYHRKGASIASTELLHTVTSGVFSLAEDDEVITGKPTAGIMKRLNLRRQTNSIEGIEPDDLQAAIDAVPAAYRSVFVFLAHTGARIGEALALTWDDINWRKRTVRIDKTGKDGRVRPVTKTYVARSIEISDDLLVELTLLKKRENKAALAAGRSLGLLFNEDGRMLSDNTLRRIWSKACCRAGIGHRRLHDIRHAVASILLARGASVTYVSQLLGHSNSHITLARYSHALPRENQGMINLLTDIDRNRAVSKAISAVNSTSDGTNNNGDTGR